MARLQFEIAVLLAICAITSLSALLLSRAWSRDGKIQLPLHTEENGTEDLTPDPFDVITAEDCLEGYPIEEEIFWKRVRVDVELCQGF